MNVIFCRTISDRRNFFQQNNGAQQLASEATIFIVLEVMFLNIIVSLFFLFLLKPKLRRFLVKFQVFTRTILARI